jgi:Skp family chaperone for outer membrane proteins
VKKFSWMAAAAASLVALVLAAPAAAQPAAAARPQVALVDVNFIFKNHARFKMRMEEFRQEVTRAEADAKQKSEAVRKLAERLQSNEFTRGSQEYKQLEEDIVHRRSELTANVELQRRQFAQQEAKVYYDTYQEVVQEVKSYCEQYGIPLVMNFKHDAINGDNPEEIVSGINRSIVYSSSQLDITPAILERVGRAPTAQRPAAPAGVNWQR